MATVESYHFFWGGVLSQWHRCTFKVSGVRYNCAEQYMMAEKARLFGDEEALAQILAATNPRRQKAQGRKVRGYSDRRWDAVAREVVYRGNLAKFSQNPDLKAVLLGLAGLTIVEASPQDDKWGIGLAEDDPRALDPRQWRGSNWLGQALMRVRDELLAREGVSPDAPSAAHGR